MQTRPAHGPRGRRRLLAVAGLGVVALLADTGRAQGPPEGGPTRQPPRAEAEAEAAEETPRTVPAPAPPAPDPSARRSSGRFTPSEEIDAESVISFPSDI